MVHERLYTSFHSQVELMKSMRANTRWISTLLNLASLVALASYVFVDSATGLNGLSESLFFSHSEELRSTTSISVVTLLLALFLVNAILSIFVLVVKMCVCLCVILANCIFECFSEVESHRDDDGDTQLHERYEKATTAIKMTEYIGLLYRTLLPIPFSGEHSMATHVSLLILCKLFTC